MRLEGIHHISAITGDAPANVDFYTRVLGLRLAAKTVNQDDPGVYHLFYADEQGSPGAELTFSSTRGLAAGARGGGWSTGSCGGSRGPTRCAFWRERLAVEGVETGAGGRAVRFDDPEGVGHELIIDARDAPFTRTTRDPRRHAIGGFVGVRALRLSPTERATARAGTRAQAMTNRHGTSRGRRGATIAFDPPPPERGLQGSSTVHHVAWGTDRRRACPLG